MYIQSTLLIIVSGLIIFDAYLTYTTYRQTQIDYTSMKYDLEAIRVALNMIHEDVDCHKDYIKVVKTDLEAIKLRGNEKSAYKSRRPKKHTPNVKESK